MKIWIFAIFILILGCRQFTHPVKQVLYDFPKIIDSLPSTEKMYAINKMRVPINDICFVGKVETSMISTYEAFSYIDFLEFTEYADSGTKNQGLQIFVDTTQLLSIDLEEYSIPPMPIFLDTIDYEYDSLATEKIYAKWRKRPRDYVQALPVFVVNTQSDTIYLNMQDGRTFMIQEAKNENGEWKPIEYWRYSSCGYSYGAFALYPNYCALTKIFKYSGDFETELRIKLKNADQIIYSDSFKGKINKDQFELPLDYNDPLQARKARDKDYLNKVFLNNL